MRRLPFLPDRRPDSVEEVLMLPVVVLLWLASRVVGVWDGRRTGDSWSVEFGPESVGKTTFGEPLPEGLKLTSSSKGSRPGSSCHCWTVGPDGMSPVVPREHADWCPCS